MKRSKSSDFQKAARYALLLLKFRQRSEKELIDRFEKKGYSSDVIKNTLHFCKKNKLVDDTAFATAWVESRISKAVGLKRIKAELKEKGIEQKTIDSAVNSIKEDCREKDIILKLFREELASNAGIDPERLKKRLYAYFVRRGFSPELVYEVLSLE